jgi:hypothetical protein
VYQMSSESSRVGGGYCGFGEGFHRFGEEFRERKERGKKKGSRGFYSRPVLGRGLGFRRGNQRSTAREHAVLLGVSGRR